jgi:hypothetical protein
MGTYQQKSRRGAGIFGIVFAVLVFVILPFAPMKIYMGFMAVLLLVGGFVMLLNNPKVIMTEQEIVLKGNIVQSMNKSIKWDDIARAEIINPAGNQMVLRFFSKDMPEQLLGVIGGLQDYPGRIALEKAIEANIKQTIKYVN